MKLRLVEELSGGAEKEFRFKVKKWGVVQPRRRSVKRMMFDQIVKSVSSLFLACCHPDHTSGVASTSLPKYCGSLEGEVINMVAYGEANSMKIFPKKDHLLAINASENDPSTNMYKYSQ